MQLLHTTPRAAARTPPRESRGIGAGWSQRASPPRRGGVARRAGVVGRRPLMRTASAHAPHHPPGLRPDMYPEGAPLAERRGIRATPHHPAGCHPHLASGEAGNRSGMVAACFPSSSRRGGPKGRGGRPKAAYANCITP